MFSHLRMYGFSLIELMIVVSIIGILAMIAAPSYQHYTQRARFAEVISIADSFKTAVSLALQQGASSAELTHGKYGIPAEPKSTQNLASLHVESGVITAISTERAGNATYVLKPSAEGSVWTISGSCLKSGFCNA
ncbi:pilin [Aquicella lusitana]|jgi:prepilin-type N-terminal cleavage/methylation domain|uniref:Type IV pilus assembly protein PilA/prepilin peptidase dependent protein D n=1 Tax=Aquicella lusitana TaxID=254246 RepID=A0A370GD83_9COXI|nr:prepilin-type N-terminal cleavage/methylation domain-containing protein [Aquicella lusitana]RDI41785.1 type IV pilus assembly protein PilA/prepilin peptidase dependent protein D [Aquicella lusitana]VVC73694.1 Fimbrial protein [Aquicella lusitana]